MSAAAHSWLCQLYTALLVAKIQEVRGKHRKRRRWQGLESAQSLKRWVQGTSYLKMYLDAIASTVNGIPHNN